MIEQPLVAGPRTRRRCRHAVALVAGAALVVALSACGDDDDKVPADAGAASTMTGSSWTLAGAAIDGQDVAAVGTATLEFDADGATLAGSTGCNQFSGTYTQSGSDLSIALGPVTQAACVDPGATAQEAAILAHLPEVASYTMDQQLVLKDSNDETLLAYNQGLAAIEGTSWTATGVNNGRGGVETSAATETVTAEFGSDGALSGFAGCNSYHATYTVSGDDAISIADIAITQKACEDGAMTLERQYVGALANASTYTISGDTLTLRDSTGSTQVTYTLAR
jgi:heat shock protein HslJ